MILLERYRLLLSIKKGGTAVFRPFSICDCYRVKDCFFIFHTILGKAIGIFLRGACQMKLKEKQQTGAQLFIDALKEEQVEIVFGYPGGSVLPLYDCLYSSDLRHILTRHEQGAVHAAEGYARVTGKAGVVIVTSGPGATNVLTGLGDAMIDSLPLVVFTGQVSTNVIGSDAFQEGDLIGLTMPITKHNYQIRNVSDLPRIIKEAFHIATTGRPGPVVIDLPKDMITGFGEKLETIEMNLPGYQPTIEPNKQQLQKLVKVLELCQKPVIAVGAGVLHAKASAELLKFVEHYQIPVVHTLSGIGAFPANHPLNLGMGGMHGTYAANMALYECDYLINFGGRFDDRFTANLDYFAKNAKIAHIDIDPVEIGKNVETDIPVVGDAKRALIYLNEIAGQAPNIDAWMNLCMTRKQDYPLKYEQSDTVLKPQYVLEILNRLAKEDAIVVTDVGQQQMWAAQFFDRNCPDTFVSSGGFGTMGFGLPAAIGAQFAYPDREVYLIVGDAGFQMTMQELSVIEEHQLPIRIVLINNHALGMVRQWQELLYEERYSHSLLPVQPDFMKISEAYNIKGIRVTDPKLAETQLKEAVDFVGPVLIECIVPQKELVYPMVQAGKGIHEMEGV